MSRTQFVINMLVVLVAGGLTGALLTSYINLQRQRKDVALRVTDLYLSDIYLKIAHARFFMENRVILQKVAFMKSSVQNLVVTDETQVNLISQFYTPSTSEISSDKGDSKLDPMNHVVMVGDWLNFVAALCEEPTGNWLFETFKRITRIKMSIIDLELLKISGLYAQMGAYYNTARSVGDPLVQAIDSWKSLRNVAESGG